VTCRNPARQVTKINLKNCEYAFAFANFCPYIIDIGRQSGRLTDGKETTMKTVDLTWAQIAPLMSVLGKTIVPVAQDLHAGCEMENRAMIAIAAVVSDQALAWLRTAENAVTNAAWKLHNQSQSVRHNPAHDAVVLTPPAVLANKYRETAEEMRVNVPLWIALAMLHAGAAQMEPAFKPAFEKIIAAQQG
jgi:hypothetical protein